MELTSLYDKTILLCDEGYSGDVIQFCRFVPQVAARGAQVILQAPVALKGLMASLTGGSKIVDTSEVPSGFDFYCPLMDLPAAFGTRVTSVPAAVPYLRPPVASVVDWKTRLGAKGKPRVGIAWASDARHDDDDRRSIGLSKFLALAKHNVTLISLQSKAGPREEVIAKDILHFDETQHDFSQMAALMMNLDLVISVDASVAHLAGAVGRPVWILLPILPDWRWLLGRNNTPWYPTARLFRQSRANDWDDVLAEISAELPRQLSRT